MHVPGRKPPPRDRHSDARSDALSERPRCGFDARRPSVDGGICGEAASLAEHLRLANLCWVCDNNRITIEGDTALAFPEDVGARLMGYGWNVILVGDANDVNMLARAFQTLQSANRPSLIIVESHIGYGAPHKQDTSVAHGEPLAEEEVRLAKRNYGWPEDKKFYVPAVVYDLPSS